MHVPSWQQAPWGTPPQLLGHWLCSTANTAGRLAVSDMYCDSAWTLIAALAQKKSHGLHEFPSEMLAQSVSTVHDRS
jgi:hypothetical protein